MRSEFLRSAQSVSGVFVLASALLAGCTYDFSMFRNGRDGAVEGGTDAQLDAPIDVAVTDARPDVTIDAPADVAMDVVTDARADVVVTDVRVDATADTRVDATADASRDTGPAFDGGCGAVRINEVQTATTRSAADEFIELYNAGSCAVNLEGWSLRYRAADGRVDIGVWVGAAGNTIASRGFFTVASAMLIGSATPPTAMLTGGGSSGRLSGGGGGIGLYPVATGGTPIETMGYGRGTTNDYVVGMPAPAPEIGESVARSPDGHDTGNNASDFAARVTPSPGRANGP